MLSFHRLYSKFPAKKLGLGLEKKTNKKKTTKLKKETMDFNKCSTYSEYRNWQCFCDTSNDHTNHFNLMSYNILSQDLLKEHMHLYLGINNSLLVWEYRLKKLKAEILTLKPDILCLQEMKNNHLKNVITAIDAGNNFEYIFKKKTGTRTDGCAIIYNRKKFKLLEEYTVEYWKSDVGLLNRENIAIIAKFCVKSDESKIFLVATTHLLYNPKREDVRVAQINLLLTELELRSLQPHKSNNTFEKSNRLPVFLTGDFNFEPSTSPHQLVITGNLMFTKQPKYNSSNTYNKLLSHSLKLSSAGGENNASTFQNKWITVDYIFYSTNAKDYTIKISGVYNLPSKQACLKMGRIPSENIGSDHLCLLVKFSLEKPTT